MTKTALVAAGTGAVLVAGAAGVTAAVVLSVGGAVAAFPGAQGFGADTLGGRGGKVIKVSNLNDSGSGSLRTCLTASGPRICVFSVAGYINLNSSITISNPFLTIAGQTAPGDGITVRSSSPTAEAMIKVAASDVVLRYFRIRTGTPVLDNHVLGVNPGQRVVIDHMSLSWNGDEQLIVYGGATDVTVSWTIDSEAMNAEGGAVASKGYVQGPAEVLSKVSVHHSLFAHNNQRNPNTRGVAGSLIDWRFNTVYNYSFSGLHLKDAADANVVGNTIKKGPLQGGKAYIWDESEGGVFSSGNQALNGAVLGSGEASEAYAAPAVDGGTAASEYARVLAEAGASRRLDCLGQWVPRRDAVDTRVVQEVVNGTASVPAGFLDDETQVGGYPALDPGTPCLDSDSDGMPDAWEQAHPSGDIEEYLNGVVEPPPTTTEPPTTTDPVPACPTSGPLQLRIVSQTATTVTLGWDAQPGAEGYRFSRSDSQKRSHTWNGAATSTRFSKGAACYGVEAIDIIRTGAIRP